MAHANAEPEQTVLPEIHDYEPYDHSRFEKRPAFLPQYGNINFSNAGTRYVDSGHWTAILDKVTLIFYFLTYHLNYIEALTKGLYRS